jgi:uncharacterized protein (TIGR01244 family)
MLQRTVKSVRTLWVLGLLLVPVAGRAEGTERAVPATALLAIPNARIPADGVLSGGQPTREQLLAAGRAGFRTVINLRLEAEPGFEWEPETVKASAMRYVHIPVAGAEGLTRENVERVDAALREALAAGPTILHCASGNRIGAVLALREAWLRGASPDAALKVGLAAGLTGLEPRTRELLGRPVPAPAATSR